VPPVALAFDDVGSGPVVVLVHGHPFDRSMWAPQVQALGSRFRVVAPDLRGFGDSPATPGIVPMGELADDVWELLGRLGVGDVAVVGLSMGGVVAMEMATSQPDRMWGLGLVATTAAAVTSDERRQRMELADEVERMGMSVLVESMAPRLFGPGTDDRVVAQVTEMMRRNNPVGAAAALRGRAHRPDYRAGLRALRTPTFVCTGSCDPWSTAAVTHELVACLRQPRRLTLADVGHLPNLEAPERFDLALGDFLDATWAAPLP
jgi:pimeloyl-ACP methyl ester carboxylesterase